MKEIRLGARLSAYSKVEAVSCANRIQDATKCDIDKMFGEPCEMCDEVYSELNEVTCKDVDSLFE